jgi:hypothetical protein
MLRLVTIVTRQPSGRTGVQIPEGAMTVFFRYRVQTGSEAHPVSSIQWLQGVPPLTLKQPGCDSDHSLPSGTEIMNAWSLSILLQYVFIARCLIK